MVVRTLDDVRREREVGATPNPWAGQPANGRPQGNGQPGHPAQGHANFTTAGGYTPIPDQHTMRGAGPQDVYIDCCGETVPASELTPWQLPLAMCCPCCIGDPCSSNRQNWYLTQLKTFIGIISVVEIIIFIMEVVISGTWGSILAVPTETLIKMGGKVSILVAAGEYWRLVTPIVLHAGIMHLLVNVFTQMMFGIQLEREWGAVKVAVVYLVCGIYGNILSVLYAPATVSIGCSGSIFGLFGGQIAFIFCQWKNMGDLQRKMLMMSLGISFIFIFIFSFGVGVDMSAHLGGFLCGLVIGQGDFAHLQGEGSWWGNHGKVIAYSTIACTTLVSLIYFWHQPEMGYMGD